jgi:hypothetical protein
MIEQPVEFVMYRDVQHLFLHSDVYAYRANGKLPWLQRLCFWVLEKLDAQWREHVVKTERVSFLPRDFMESLFRQKPEVAAMLGREPATLLIGAPDFEELMRQPEIHQYCNFHAIYGKDRRLLDLKVQIVPWMRGLLVMP